MRTLMLFVLSLALLASCFAQTTAPAAQTGYAPVNGLKLYYEIRGTGEPLILLHGGVVGIIGLGNLPAALAENRKVIAVELQGHGRTADIDRPFSCQAMADDIAALIKYLKLPRADVAGYSLGGAVALQTAIRHPELVGKLVLVSTAFSRNGWYPEVQAEFDKMGPQGADVMKQTPLAKIYPDVKWDVLFTKLGELLRQPYDWSAGVSGLKMPVLLVFADADAIRPEHEVAFYQLLGGGKNDAGLDGSKRAAAQLAILPGRTHYNIAESPALPGTIAAFLK